MNERDDRLTRDLERRVAELPREITPQRDLWSGIEMRLTPRAATPRRRVAQWPWLPMTAALVAGYALAIWLPLPQFVAGSVSPVTPVATTWMHNMQPALQQLPAKTRAVVEADLTGLGRDWQRIEDALAEDPGNPLLQELQMHTADRAESVRMQMNRLAGSGDEGIDI